MNQVFHLQYYHGGSKPVQAQNQYFAECLAENAAKPSGATVRLYDSQLKELGKAVFNRALGVWQFEGA